MACHVLLSILGLEENLKKTFFYISWKQCNYVKNIFLIKKFKKEPITKQIIGKGMGILIMGRHLILFNPSSSTSAIFKQT